MSSANTWFMSKIYVDYTMNDMICCVGCNQSGAGEY